ncbi:MAG: ribonuclease D [Pseudomonadota bacterium]
MQIISNTSSLKKFCQHLSKKEVGEYITIDTEFVRTDTYRSKLCLVQIAGSEQEALIDPLAPGLDLSFLRALLQDENILKVFHSGRQDLEIFYQMWGELPRPIFDTQVAAMVCGYGESVGYDSLVQSICQKKVDKSFQFMDWARRPLSKQQEAYAIRDVTYLRPIYQYLRGQLESTGRQDWIAEEMVRLQDPNIYEIDVDNIWRRIKTRGDNPRFLARLQALAKVRELEAQRHNKLRHHVLKDSTLIELAANPPHELKNFSIIKGISSGVEDTRLGCELWQALQDVQKLSIDQCPQKKVRIKPASGKESELDLLQLWLKVVCRREKVAPKLVGTSRDLEIFIGNQNDTDLALLRGWRYELFGKDALALLSGEKGIAHCRQTKSLELVDIPK